ncbi:MFS transporter [Roseiconus lacunae]|uniref:MFS transporter n=1 Tax=Roseiconus lacunae TaxID=2605694 RepID=UPI0011F0A5AC|nr:MFS transporter [Roseiconus lacunae]MCD0460434.1 MFS transporter [Roseiconus lacunae]
MRWLIILSTFLLSVLLYVDRVCISVAKDAVVSDLHFSDKQIGWVFSAFALGYALFQTPSGWLADRLGPRRVLTLIVAGWSIFTGLTAAANQFLTMLLVRFLFGAAEAGAFPGMSRAVFSWIPMNERGRAQAINFSGSRIGAALTLPIISWLVVRYGWRVTFVVLMITGLVWAIGWLLFFRDDPADAGWLSETERDHILETRQATSSEDSAEQRSLSATVLLTSSNMPRLCAQYFASNFMFFFALTWFFPQMKERYDLTGVQASLFAAAPLLFGAIGCWVSGFWMDRLYSSGHWVRSRRLPAIAGFCFAAIGIVASAHASTPLASSMWFSLCIFGADMTLPPSWSVCVDIGRKASGVVSGTMNMAGNVGSFLTSLAFPYMLEWTGSPLPYFYLASVLSVVAVIMWMSIDPTHPITPAPVATPNDSVSSTEESAV